MNIDPKLDLVLERVIDVPRDLVWKAWTQPEHVKKWFTPAPWTTVDCSIDLRPGGLFRTVMRSPEGTDHSNVGCYLEVVTNERLVWTDALVAGYRPAPPTAHLGFHFTATLLLEAKGASTKYTAIVRHGDEESCRKHDAMGFSVGWGAALDQLVAHMKSAR
jgi:uncharacterized protein YndB with AHSA1/START domain